MKKRIFTIIFSLTMLLSVFSVTAWGDTEIAINKTNFPDAVFCEYVAETFDINEDNMLSPDEIAQATGIYVVNMEISDLTGIEHFTALEVLDCSQNNLTTLNMASNSELEELYCDQNKLTSLNVSSNTALIELNCSVNTELGTLVVSANTALEALNCQTTGISDLNVRSNIALRELICGGNPLELLDVSNCLQLEKLICPATNISELDVSANTQLTELVCEDNCNLNTLNVGGNTELVHLNCTFCNLTELDVSNCPNLKELLFALNELTTIDLSNNPMLNWIECDHNNLIKLDVSRCLMLECLECGQNYLTELDVSKNNALVQLICPYNYLTELDLSGLSNVCELICDYNNMTELDIRPTQSCMEIDNKGYFGDYDITVFMTAEQKAGFDAYFAGNSRNAGVVAVVDKPVIITKPADYSGVIGSTATFSVVAKGEGLSYQWEYCAPGEDIWKDCSQTGSKTDKLSVPITKENNGQIFRCKVTDCNGGFIYSNVATLTVKSNPEAPVNPNTGDDTQIVLWGSLLLILGAAITVIALKLRRKED